MLVESIRDHDFVVPRGFNAGSYYAGIKPSGRKDLVLFTSDYPCSGAGLFTRNRFAAAPVQVCRDLLERGGGFRGIIVNAGNANACTGTEGIQDANEMCRLAGESMGVLGEEILVSSTGVIGQLLPMDKIRNGISKIGGFSGNSDNNFVTAAESIMTTDTWPKWSSSELEIKGKTVRILGLAKGSGMIHPDLATMLIFLFTDVSVQSDNLQSVLRKSVEVSFHCMTVDGDTSTNDSVLILSNGASGVMIDEKDDELELFQLGLTEVCKSLARQIACDGEGAHHFVEILVQGAESFESARQAGLSIARSPLVKTAICGKDPNWGRILMAIGNSGVAVNTSGVYLTLNGHVLYANGRPQVYDKVCVSESMDKESFVKITVDLGTGGGESVIWTCDLTSDYIRINSEYTT